MSDPMSISQAGLDVQSEINLYKEVLGTMSEGVCILEKSGKVVNLDENVERILGHKLGFFSESSLRELGIEYVREDGSPLLYSELPGAITLEQGIPFDHFTFGVRNRNQAIKWLSVNSRPLKICENGQQATLLTFSDITERKKMDSMLIQEKKAAEKANMAKSEFLSKMSHELRTPLNGILGFAQLLELDESLNEQQRDFVQEILNGGRHLLDLINEILDLSRIETGNLKVSIEEVHFLTILDECINIVQPLAKKKNISIHKPLDLWQNISVLADPIRLKQILLNLLDNAIKYNRESGKVNIVCHLEGNELVIHIVDTGEGFSAEEYHKVFVPFYRIDGTKEEGTGIGLALVKQLVHLMEGKISVRSKKGIGSDF